MQRIVYLTDATHCTKQAAAALTYVRAHARAAIALGFEPHVFTISPADGVPETDFGIIHHVPAPLHKVRMVMQPEFRDAHTPLHMPRLKATVLPFLVEHPEVRIIHSFSHTANAAANITGELARVGRPVAHVASSFTTRVHEAKARLVEGPGYGLRRRLRYRAVHAWIRYCCTGVERSGYQRARLILVNYESVRRLLMDSYPNLPEIRRVPYTSEIAFLSKPARGEPPEEVRALSNSESPLLLSLSRHDPRKGVHVLIEALGILKRQGVEFRACLLGPGPLKRLHSQL